VPAPEQNGTPAHAEEVSPDQPPENEQTIEHFGPDDTAADMPGDLAAMLGPALGMDGGGLMDMLGAEGITPEQLQELLGGFGNLEEELPDEKPPVPFATFDEVVVNYEKEHPVPQKSDRDRELSYEGAESEAVEPLESGEVKLLKKYNHFVTKTLAGKGKATMLLLSYVMYRQATWIWRKWWKESKCTPALPRKTLLDSLLGIREFPGSIGSIRTPGLWTFDLLFRSFFSVTQLWIGLRSWWQTTQLIMQRKVMVTPEQQAHHFYRLNLILRRSWRFFTRPTYYGMHLSLGQEAMVELALPFVYASFMSKDPIGHRVFKKALASTISGQIQYAGLSLYNRYTEKVPEDQRASWFNATLGVMRPHMITDVSTILASAAHSLIRYGTMRGVKKAVGTEVIRLVYLYIMTGMLRTATRHGAARHLHSLGHAACQGLVKVGIIGTNPLDTLHDKIVQRLCKLQLMRPDEPLCHGTSILGYMFPGALVRAVRQVVKKPDLPLALYRSPRFVTALGKLDRISPADTLYLMFSGMQEAPMEVYGGVQSIMNGVPKDKRTAVLTCFLDEVIAEVLFNRDMPTCWLFTETILGWMGNNLLTQVGMAIL
jgi:hypothetical protein